MIELNMRAAGGLQQRETALLMDEVCGLIGGCTSGGVINTGDNFYECVRAARLDLYFVFW